MPRTRRLQLLSAFAFFASLWFVVGRIEGGVDAAIVAAFTACIAAAAGFAGLERRARREDEIARMNRSPESP